MDIKEMNINELVPYENNPRHNDDAVEAVAASINEFGFKVPIIIDKNNVIVAGHTRWKASKQLGLENVPVIVADDLTEEQINAFRLADNRTNEMAEWDFSKLEEELNLIDIDMSQFGFKSSESSEIEWADVEELSEETYEEPKKELLKCPHCGHIDSKAHFMRVEEDPIEISQFEVRNAIEKDIDGIKKIADKEGNQDEIGFVLREALVNSMKKKNLLVAIDDNEKVLGFCNYNARKDGVNTIYEICTSRRYRGNGIGKALMDKVPRPIRLKCPVDNASNDFYKHYGFTLVDVEDGKNRKLNVWEIQNENIS